MSLPPAIIATLEIVAPFVAGALAGGMLRAGLRRRGLPLIAVAVIVLALLVLAGAIAPFGVWDRVLVIGLAVAGFLRGTRPPVPHGLLRRDVPVVLVLIATFGLLEIAARLLLPAPPVPPEPYPRLVIDVDKRASFSYDPQACRMLFPAEHPELVTELAPPTTEKRARVLHLGDSIVYAWDVPPGKTVPALLGQWDEGRSHTSLAIPGASADFHLLMVRRWWDAVHPDLVVIHLFLGNDIQEVGRGYACCEDRSLLVERDGALVARCEHPRAVSDTAVAMRHAMTTSPPPYPLRAAAGASQAARHLAVAFRRLSLLLGSPPYSNAQGWAETERALGVLRDEVAAHGARAVVVLPVQRAELGPVDGRELLVPAEREDALAMCGRLGLEALDALPAMKAAAAEHGVDALFLHLFPGDSHLSEEGHRVMARWLLEALPR